jgi:hypothetical protein
MKCKECELYLKRPLPKRDKEYHPTGICLNVQHRDKDAVMLTSPDTNCSVGQRKESQ